MEEMSEERHERVKSNGIWIHVAEQGSSGGGGPLVLLLHGFPETWYTWRHQMKLLAEHGYHVVAPDLRGYGDSDSPLSSSSYTVLHIVADLVGLIDHFDQPKAFIVGSDWGAVAGWHLSLLRPERVMGLVAISVPFSPRSLTLKPIEYVNQVLGDGSHVIQFQEPGRAEKSFARYDYLTVMKKFFLTTKKELIAPPDMEIIDYLNTPWSVPTWIAEEELQVYADKFEESGFTGAFNHYRAMDLSWELLAPWQGAKISVPSKFIAGDKDFGFESFGTKEYVHGEIFKELVPGVEVVILDGHHFIHKEKPHEVFDEIHSFLQKHSVPV